jgi:hypothetical protein
MNFYRISENIIANIVTVGLLVGVATFISIDIKRELFFNGTTKTTYKINLF